jgi:hypothetical protein
MERIPEERGRKPDDMTVSGTAAIIRRRLGRPGSTFKDLTGDA